MGVVRVLVIMIVLGHITGCVEERIVYVDAENTEATIVEENRVAANVVRSSVTHVDGTPYLTANGRVINYGPSDVHSVRVWIGSNYGEVRISQSIPSRLGVDESGTWQVSNLEGTYVQFKNVTFQTEGNP